MPSRYPRPQQAVACDTANASLLLAEVPRRTAQKKGIRQTDDRATVVYAAADAADASLLAAVSRGTKEKINCGSLVESSEAVRE